MTYATATFPQASPFDGLLVSLGECRRVLRPAALTVATALAACAAAGVVTMAAAWMVSTVCPVNASLATSGRSGIETAVLSSGTRMYAVPRIHMLRVAMQPVQALPPLFEDEAASLAEPAPAPGPDAAAERAAPPLLDDALELTGSMPSPAAALFENPSDPAQSTARFSLGYAAPKLAAFVLPPSPRAERPQPLRGLPREIAIMQPEPGSRIAVYDIEARMVYLPNGEKLEAHSGLGHRRDNPDYIHEKNRGPTPPNVYDLRLREAPFHGIRAIRLNPVAGSRMYGRDGILAHTYMLGPTGQSFGCVSFKNYNAFLRAFLNGEFDRLVVVPRLGSLVSTAALTRSGLSEQAAAEQ